MSIDIVDEFALDCKARGFSDRTIESYKSCIRHYLKLCSYNSYIESLKKFLNHIRDEKHYSASTCNGYFASLIAFFDYLVFTGRLEKNVIPLFRRRYMRSYKNFCINESRQLISVEEMARLVDQPDELTYRALILFLCKTGVRRNELITLDIDDIDIDSMTVHLKHTAKRSNRVIFFDYATRVFLKSYIESRSDHCNA